jgi:hypothetical protein
MSHRVPDRMERLAITSRKEDLVLESPVVEPEKPKKPAPEAPSGDSIDMGGVVAGSAMDSLDRLRTASALCWEQYKAALEAGESAKADLWRKDWLAAEEKARHWEKDINGILANRGELVKKADLIPMLVTLAGTLRRNFIASMKTFARDVAPNLSDAEIDEFASPHVEECFRKLRENEFSLALRA